MMQKNGITSLARHKVKYVIFPFLGITELDC